MPCPGRNGGQRVSVKQRSSSMRWLSLLVLGAVFVVPSAWSRQPVETFAGQVVAVADGDTITVLDSSNRQHRVRLASIDAPEKRQAFGQVSKKHLSDLVFGKTVTVEARTTDRYGRTVGRVLVDGRDACLEQIRAGLAWHYKRFERDQPAGEAAAYAAAEVEARDAGRGLWRDRNPIPPWEFRHPPGQKVSVADHYAGSYAIGLAQV